MGCCHIQLALNRQGHLDRNMIGHSTLGWTKNERLVGACEPCIITATPLQRHNKSLQLSLKMPLGRAHAAWQSNLLCGVDAAGQLNSMLCRSIKIV